MFGCFAKAGGNKMSRPTPETDAALYPINGVDIVWPEFARQLERERDEAREALEFRLGLFKVQEELFENARSECDELRKAIKNFYKAKGRHNSQIAAARMFELVGLPAEYPQVKAPK
jgi:hypothetical protein